MIIRYSQHGKLFLEIVMNVFRSLHKPTHELSLGTQTGNEIFPCELLLIVEKQEVGCKISSAQV